MEGFSLVALSTGDLLREAVAADTNIGRRAKAVIDAGQLVSDDIIISMIAECLDGLSDDHGVILDGVPRTAAQAESLDQILAQRSRKVDYVVELAVDDDLLAERITGRFTCAQCGAGYHDLFKQPKIENVCDLCGTTEFNRRSDDTVETVRARLATYHAETVPLLSYYRDRGVVRPIDAAAPIDEVTRQIESVLRAA